MELTRQDIDGLIRQFRMQPSEHIYTTIKTWYETNISTFMDQEYIICVYLFLLGANIKKRYEEISYEQHRGYIKEIRDIIEKADPLVKSQRKTYLDYGTK